MLKKGIAYDGNETHAYALKALSPYANHALKGRPSLNNSELSTL